MNALPILDQAKLAPFRLLEKKSGKLLIPQLARSFLDELPNRLIALSKECETGNWTELSRESHSLKSSSAYLGALRMSEICAEIEEMTFEAQKVDVPKLRVLLDRLADVAVETHLAVQELL